MIELARAAQRGGRWNPVSNRKYRDGWSDEPAQTPGIMQRIPQTFAAVSGAAHVTTWRFNWRGILRIAAILILAVVLAVAFTMTCAALVSCSAIQHEVPQADSRTGEKLYVDPDGKNASTKSTDAQGNPRKEFTLPENNGVLDTVGQVAGQVIPQPFGALGTMLFSFASAGATAWALRERAKRLAEAGLTEELVTSIDTAPEARAAVAQYAGGGHSLRLKNRVLELRDKRAKLGAKPSTARQAPAERAVAA